MSSQWGLIKLLKWLVSHKLTAFFLFLPYFWLNEMAILSKIYKPDKFELHSSLKLSFNNIPGFHFNFVESEFFLVANSLDIHALCGTNLDNSIYSSNFSVRGYLSLMWKDVDTHMHGLAGYVKEGLTFV